VGMKQKLMDSSVARLYGWNPTTDLKAGIKKTIEWFMENLTNE
jgi:nucleoside-diphosphate-sugar epimerase